MPAVPTDRSRLARALLAAVLAAILFAGCGGKDATRGTTRSGSLTAEKLYSEGKRQLRAGGYDSAVLYFERLSILYPFSEESRQAQLDLIYAYYRRGDKESAIDTADQFVREHPTHPDVDYAYYLRGLIYFDRDPSALEKLFRADLTKRPTGDSERSLRYFNDLVRRFPDSEYAADARQRILFLRERLAQHEIHVAEYYMTRDAWVAAVKRAKNVVDFYQDTSSVEPALRTLARAYRELGMEELAADAERVLQENDRVGGEADEQRRRGLFGRKKNGGDPAG